MARPQKNNATYFTHDADMRNDTKIKAVRAKFGITGYAVWCMLLEKLTSSNEFEMLMPDSIDLELLAGDFGIESKDLTAIINYCVDIRLLVLDVKNQVLASKTLKLRLQQVLDNRKRKREWAQQRWNVDDTNEVLDVQNGVVDKFSTSKTMQTKVNKNKYILYSKKNPKDGEYVDYDKFQLNDGTIAQLRWGVWVDAEKTNIKINREGYPELPSPENRGSPIGSATRQAHHVEL